MNDITPKTITRQNTPTIKLGIAAFFALSLVNAHAQNDSVNGEGEYFGLADGRPFFHISAENVELSGTGNKGTGIGLTAGFESYKKTALGTPNISLSYVFADLDNDVEYDSLALMGGFRGFGTRLYPVYGLGVARQGVNYSFGENTSFNQIVYYGGIGANIGGGFNASLIYSGSTPLGEDGDNPADDGVSALSVRFGFGSFSASSSF